MALGRTASNTKTQPTVHAMSSHCVFVVIAYSCHSSARICSQEVALLLCTVMATLPCWHGCVWLRQHAVLSAPMVSLGCLPWTGRYQQTVLYKRWPEDHVTVQVRPARRLRLQVKRVWTIAGKSVTMCCG